MYHTNLPGKSFINIREYRDKVLGCWTGKNIGGTLGAPMEGQRKVFDVTFYTQNLAGAPAPNDDLDLQLAWLHAVEDYGIYRVNERVLGEYWLNNIAGSWSEYGVGKFNMANGLLPPLSGATANDQWKNSNGAWIRSEIWACLFPGEPDEAAPFAWCDACVDHADDGIYAEIFTASLESAAFVESNLMKLITCALARIPCDCRVARSVHIVLDSLAHGEDWKTAREKVVADSSDLGWFQAPANVAFVIIGLLYGQGDFERSVCLAVNCGDDTDCTGATCGAILGILHGRSGIPEKWVKPIGETIRTISLHVIDFRVPQTLGELTDRVICCKKNMDVSHSTLVRLTDGATQIDGEIRKLLSDGSETVKRVLSRSSHRVVIELPAGELGIELEAGAAMAPGDSRKITLDFCAAAANSTAFHVKFQLPEGWSLENGNHLTLIPRKNMRTRICSVLTAGEFSGAFEHIPLTCCLDGRNYPMFSQFTIPRKGASGTEDIGVCQPYFDARNRVQSQTAALIFEEENKI